MLNEALDRALWPPNWKLLISSFCYESPFWYYRPRSPYRGKKQRKFCRYVTCSQWKGEFWIQEVIRARLDTCLRLSTIDEVVSSQSQNRWIKLNYFRFVKKLLWMIWTCCFLLTIIAGIPRATTSLFFNDKRQTCLRDGKTLKAVLCTKFCPVCDKQVIASALVQLLLRINFTCIFKVFQIALVASRLGQFCENFENTREINP